VIDDFGGFNFQLISSTREASGNIKIFTMVQAQLQHNMYLLILLLALWAGLRPALNLDQQRTWTEACFGLALGSAPSSKGSKTSKYMPHWVLWSPVLGGTSTALTSCKVSKCSSGPGPALPWNQAQLELVVCVLFVGGSAFFASI